MPTVLLTGATGFLGPHVTRALAARGWRIRALCRSEPRPGSELSGLDLEIARGELSSEQAIARAAAGCEAVIHAAGLLKARSLAEYRSVNVQGTESLLRAVRSVAPEALWVQVSSQAAAGPARGGKPVKEGDPARPVSWYGISKREGEMAVEREWPGPWIVLRPSLVYGPGDRALLVLFRAASTGWVPAPASRSRIHLIAAERAAEAIARAAGAKAMAGRIGFVCDREPLTIHDFAALLSRLPPRPARVVPVPDLLVRAAGLAETLWETVTRESRPFNADKAREALASDWLCDPEPLASDLGVPPPVPVAEGLRRTWDWYLDRGWLTL
jgi:nucleoside-diphosphate-sugar epimerase